MRVAVADIHDSSATRRFFDDPVREGFDIQRAAQFLPQIRYVPEHLITAEGDGIALQETELSLISSAQDYSQPASAALSTRVLGLTGLAGNPGIRDALISTAIDPLATSTLQNTAVQALQRLIHRYSPYAPVVAAIARSRTRPGELSYALALLTQVDPGFEKECKTTKIRIEKAAEAEEEARRKNPQLALEPKVTTLFEQMQTKVRAMPVSPALERKLDLTEKTIDDPESMIKKLLLIGRPQGPQRPSGH